MKNDRQDSSDIRYSKSAFTKASAGKCQLSIYISAKERKKDCGKAPRRQNAFKCGYISCSCMMHYAEKYYADLEKSAQETWHNLWLYCLVLKQISISGSRKEVRVSNEKLLRWALSQFSPAGPSLSCAFMLKWIHFSSSAVWQHRHTKEESRYSEEAACIQQP